MKNQIKSYLKNPLITLALGGVIGTVAGAGATYFLSARKLNKAAQVLDDMLGQATSEKQEESQRLERTLQEAHIIIDELTHVGAMVVHNLGDLRSGDTPEVIIERVVNPDQGVLQGVVDGTVIIEEHFGQRPPKEIFATPDEPQTHNVFDEADDGWNYEVERNNRSGTEPYIIHVDEFVTEEMGYEQSTITWYEGDQILTDSRDIPMYNHVAIVGQLRFGHGSKDPNIVYVRNEKLQAEYEILRDEGSYEVNVLGGSTIEHDYEEADLKHSRTPRHFRED